MKHDEFEAEVREHIEQLAERFVRQGMSPEDAAQAARRQFGNLTRHQEDRRQLTLAGSLDGLVRAVRYAIRQLAAKPMFTATAVLSIALGMGANTAIFTLLDQLVLRPLPVPDAHRLVMVWSTGPHHGDTRGPRASSFPLCQDYQHAATALDTVFCRYTIDVAATVDGGTDAVRAELVSSNYFQALGAGQAAGRLLSPEADDRSDSGAVAVLSHRYWVDRFNADPRIVGRKIVVNRQPVDVAGVAGQGFTGMDPVESPQLWLPMRLKASFHNEDGLRDRHYHFLQIFGRLRDGQTVDSALASLQPAFRRALEEEAASPQIAKRSTAERERFLKRALQVEEAPGGYSELRQRYGTAMNILMGMAALILLIACSNVASLLVARALTRRREMAVRLSIGASRGTLAAHLMVESALLAAMGALGGVLLAIVATRSLLVMLPVSTTGLTLRAEPDLRVLAFGAAAAMVTAILFGLLPALQATAVDVAPALRAGSVTAAGGSNWALATRKLLAGLQVALSILLVVLAVFFSRSLANLSGSRLGIEAPRNLVTFRLSPGKSGYSAPRVRALYENILADLNAMPGVQGAALAWMPLLQGWAPSWNMQVEGYRPADGEDMEVANNVVAPGFWQTAGIRLLSGRLLDQRDRFDFSEGDKVPTRAVVNRSFARRFFPGRDAVGKHFGIGDRKHELGVEIAGVVDDSLYAGPRQGFVPAVYFSYLQANFPIDAAFYVRTSTNPGRLLAEVRRVVARHDSTLPVAAVKTLHDQLNDTLSTERLVAFLSTMFGLLAAAMAAIGIHGVLAYLVTQRSKEIGLRMALGALPRPVIWLVVKEGLLLTSAGAALGFPAAIAASRYLSSQFYGVQPGEWWVFGAAGAAMLAVAAVAAMAPVRRAVRMDPLAVLRQD